ncbi:MAG: phage tail protein [Clostridia bacterium]|nr:phage tail protein [Clostridia bacterium]
MITLHSKDSENFLNNNGIGILRDFIEDPLIKESKNGELYVECKYKHNGRYAGRLELENIMVMPAGYSDKEAFRIKKVEKVLNATNTYIYIYAQHISYDLADNILEDVYPQNLNGSGALNWILTRTQYPNRFEGYSDIIVSNSARYVSKNPIEALIGDIDNAFVKRWGGEILRNNFLISMLTRRGNDNGVFVRFRKNLKGINFSVDISSVVTRIRPVGADGIELPEIYVDSPIIANYIHPIIREIEYSDVKLKTNENDEEGFDTLEQCYVELRRRANLEYENGIDKPSVFGTIDFVELSKTEEYKKFRQMEKLNLGDTVHVYIESLGIDVSERVVSTVYNPILKKYTTLTIGNITSNYILDTKNSVESLKNEVIPSILESAKLDATNKIIHALGGNIYKTRGELFIMDTPDPTTATKVWRWNLNGLGYSSNGIDGPYELAMTADGIIVADFIKAGTMSINRISGLGAKLDGYDNSITDILLGLNNLSLILQDVIDLTREQLGRNEVYISEIRTGLNYIVEFSIEGNTEKFEELENIGLTIIASRKSRNAGNKVLTEDNEEITTEDEENIATEDKSFCLASKRITLDAPLRNLIVNQVNYFDELQILQDGTIQVLRRIGIDSENELYLLENAEVTILDEKFILPSIEGSSYYYIQELENLSYKATYIVKNKYSDYLATKAELSAGLQLKIDRENLVSELNASADIIRIIGERLIIQMQNFSLTAEGYMKAILGEIAGFMFSANKFSKNFDIDYNFTVEDVQLLMGYLNDYNSLSSGLQSLYDLVESNDLNVLDAIKMINIINRKCGK